MSFKIRSMTKSLKQALEVIYKTDTILVINKPFDIRIDGDHEITIEKMVWTQLPKFYDNTKENDLKLRFAHQLDYATSGILCMAFTRKSCHHLAHHFEDRTSKKMYLALLFGHVQEVSIQIDAPIGQDETDVRNFRMCIKKDGKPSSTKLTVLKRGYLGSQKVTKVLLEPYTGRTHQLRVHCRSIGHGIVGDYTYCNDDVTPRMMLHAWKLTLPTKPDPLIFETQDPLPEPNDEPEDKN